MGTFKDYTDVRIGRVVFRYKSPITTVRYGKNITMWVGECDCGVVRPFVLRDFVSGNTRSCGCLLREVAGQQSLIHGKSNSKNKAYNTWKRIKQRCYNPNCKDYKFYGAKGVVMHEGWINNFLAFYEYVGDAPEDSGNYSLDRINGNLGYCPDNVKWATRETQSRNLAMPFTNTSGVVGVSWDNKKVTLVSGKVEDRWVAKASWNNLDKKRGNKSFSVSKYGEELAFFMACEYREQMINLLNLQGAGYSEFHGKSKIIEEKLV